MLRKSLLAVLVSGLMVTAAQAADNQVNGYLFGSVGKADADTPDFIRDLDRELNGIGSVAAVAFNSDYDGKDTAFKVGAGVQLNRYVGLEFQYIDLGSANYKAELTDGFDTLSAKIDGDTDGFGANLVGTLPLERFKLFGKLGYHQLETKAKQKVSLVGVDSFSESDSTTEWVTSFGVGASYAFTPQVELVAEYEQYSDVADEYDVDFGSIGLRYNF